MPRVGICACRLPPKLEVARNGEIDGAVSAAGQVVAARLEAQARGERTGERLCVELPVLVARATASGVPDDRILARVVR